MPKNIVYPYMTFNRFIDEALIKKLSLFYDKIYIGDGRLSIINDITKTKMNEENQSLFYEKAVWDFLQDNEVVKLYPYLNEKFENIDADATELKRQLEEVFAKERMKLGVSGNLNEKQLEELKKQYFEHIFLSHDLSIRLDTIHLRKTDLLAEYFPLLRTPDTLKSLDKKNQVISFILNDIPEPDSYTHWDHIIEFRTDSDIRNKYLALTNWINKVSNSNLSLSEIRDEYDYLYSEYMKQFKLHKMKYSNSTLEVIVNCTVNFMANISTGNYISSVKDLFQFNIKNASLLQDEAKITGKELAYIFKAKETFK